MRTITINVGAKTDRFILGRRGENEATLIVFDVSQLIATYGEGTAVLLAKRPTDGSAYPVTVTQDGNTVTWTVTDTDTSYKGQGECELFWYVNNALAKSVVYATVIGRDIGTTTDEVPDPYEAWLDTLTEAGAEVTAAINTFTGLSAEATTLAAGSSATAQYEDGVLTLGIPKGDKGDTGEAGADAVTYVLEPSANAIVYDPNAEEGARLTPSELTLTAYQIVNGVRSAFGADYIYMSYENADTQASWAEAKGAGAIEKVYTLTHQIPSYTTPGAEIMCDMRKGSTVVARVSVPIVSSGVNGEQGPQGETGATGPAGPGVPSGGTAGQFLVKSSAADYDAAWSTLIEEVTVSTAGDVTAALDAGKIYHFTGAISSLTLTLNAAAGVLPQYHFDFDSGSTAATVSITGVTWPDGSFTPEASKRYEVDILGGYAVVMAW